jgi:hypothetical protein
MIEKGYGDARKVVAERRLVDNPTEQQWILTAYNWRSAGWSSYRIAKEFNTQGVRPKSGGKNWQAIQIDTMLDSKTVKEWFHQRNAGPNVSETENKPELVEA